MQVQNLTCILRCCNCLTKESAKIFCWEYLFLWDILVPSIFLYSRQNVSFLVYHISNSNIIIFTLYSAKALYIYSIYSINKVNQTKMFLDNFLLLKFTLEYSAVLFCFFLHIAYIFMKLFSWSRLIFVSMNWKIIYIYNKSIYNTYTYTYINVTLNKRLNWSSCTKLALSASWTHDLIAQSVRASERNLVVAGSNPTQANFL